MSRLFIDDLSKEAQKSFVPWCTKYFSVSERIAYIYGIGRRKWSEHGKPWRSSPIQNWELGAICIAFAPLICLRPTDPADFALAEARQRLME